MNTVEIELFLAKLYTDERLLKRFVESPSAELENHKLSEDSVVHLLALDLQDLQLAAESYSHKRNQYSKRRYGFLAKLRRLFVGRAPT